jgi:CRP-like cAMP-binding protein
MAGRDAALIKLPSDTFEQLLAYDKELASKIYRQIIISLCKQLRETNEVLKLIPDYVSSSIRNFDNI